MMPRAKKSFGQNWLVDMSVVEKIIAAADIQEGERVLEIGPGTGVLTQALVDAGARVTAVEADASLVEPLREKFGEQIELIEGDVLSVELPVQSGEFKLIANIPYNITSEILRRFLAGSVKPSRMVLMVQKEVADRITAVPPDMSLLSVMCQVYANCKRVTKVPAGAFRPIPKVDSAVVQLDISEKTTEPEDVLSFAKIGFSSRRKQLHKNLSQHPKLTSEMVKNALEEIGLDPRSRAENLTVENWIELTHILRKNS